MVKFLKLPNGHRVNTAFIAAITSWEKPDGRGAVSVKLTAGCDYIFDFADIEFAAAYADELMALCE